MDQTEQIKLLLEVDVLEPITNEEIVWLSKIIPERSLTTGEIVYAAGDASNVLFFSLRGRIRLYGISAGHEFTFEVVQPGTIFGEASLAGRAHPEYAQALEPALVGLVHLNIFWQLVRQNPEVNARVMKLLVNRSCKDRSRMADLAVKGVVARLASLVLDLLQSDGVVTREGHYKINAHYTHDQLAIMIGAKRVAVTRAFRTLRDSGGVHLLKRQIHVTDLGALRGVAMGE